MNKSKDANYSNYFKVARNYRSGLYEIERMEISETAKSVKERELYEGFKKNNPDISKINIYIGEREKDNFILKDGNKYYLDSEK